MTEPSRSFEASLQNIPAVILAAGQGQRLRQNGSENLKPLTPLLGLTLLERAVLSCRDAGISECYVVVGYGKDLMLTYIEALSERYQTRIHGVENPLWREGNGTSALAVMPYIHERFVLLMCDHIFDPSIIRCLIDAATEPDVCLLAVDSRTDQLFELEDATKVQRRDTELLAIGKELSAFDGVDVGLFVCWPSVFKALQEAREASDGSLTGGIRRLIPKRQIRTVDIGNRLWCDVDTPQSLVHAEHLLLAYHNVHAHLTVE
jgi:choline kinase